MQYPIKHTHQERLDLSQVVLQKLKEKYKDNLLGVAFFGSMSRNEDKDYSDVDMIAVVKGEHSADELEGIKNGLKYTVDIFSQDVVHDKITSITIRWPLLVGKFVTALPIYDPTHIFSEYKSLYETTIQNDFRPFIRQIFIQEVYEDCNKAINISLFGTREQVVYNVFHLLTKMISLLGVINKSYYLSSVSFLEDARKLSINFPSFIKLSASVVEEKPLTTDEYRQIVQNMLNEMTTYFSTIGIKVEDE